MKYLLLYKIDQLSKNVLVKSYQDDGFEIISDIDNNILLRKNSIPIIDEDIYIKIINSYLKRSEMFKKIRGKIIDITNAFKYASSKNGYNKFDNKFEWYIKNIMINEIINV
jgi:hypothetical protein